MKTLKGKVALVAGASRGIGKGIALGLGEAGATVYVTGRTQTAKLGVQGLEGTIAETAAEVSELGGRGVAIQCDHTDDDQVKSVFDRITAAEKRLDILANSVWGGYEGMFSKQGEYLWELPFWEQPCEQWELMFSAGVRAHYVASRYAARMMYARKCGLIVNISHWAAQKYSGNVCYGISKAAADKLTHDCAVDLEPHQVAVVSLYPGLVRTERVMRAAEFLDLSKSESPKLTGRVVAALYADPALMHKSGQWLVTAQLAQEYGVTDIDAKSPVPLTIEDV